MKPECRQATTQDAAGVCSILQEAVSWLDEIGQPLWRLEEVSESAVAQNVAKGYFYLFEIDGEAVGTLKFQLEDKLFWPDVPDSESAFIHRVAIRRAWSGSGLSSAMIKWAISQARHFQRDYLRLDCDASRPKLKAIYEHFGFSHRDDRQVGPFCVSRYEISTRFEA
ncbi:MAG: GNAT family N-acetyltransferase [Verrucomicrobiales bacterium]|nr:GNAT family N-acetyltransferase [Verrucomicrobiales bacterium]